MLGVMWSWGEGLGGFKALVAEWIHFTVFGAILPTIELKVYAFWGLVNSATKTRRVT